MFFLEVVLGQYTSEGGITCWEKICPIFTGKYILLCLTIPYVAAPFPSCPLIQLFALVIKGMILVPREVEVRESEGQSEVLILMLSAC